MLFREKSSRVRSSAATVAFFEGADEDVAVLPKPLILNPAGPEGQVLINALVVSCAINDEKANRYLPWSRDDSFGLLSQASFNTGSADAGQCQSRPRWPA